MNGPGHIQLNPAFEGLNIEALKGSSPSTGVAPAFDPVARFFAGGTHNSKSEPDDELLTQAKLVEELSAREHEHFARDPDHLPEDDAEAIAWREQANVVSEEFRAGIERLASLPAATPVGLAAKASATLKMNAMFDHLREWQEVDLVRGLAEDAVRLGTPVPDECADGDVFTEAEAAAIEFEPWDTDAAKMLDEDEWNREMSVSGGHAVNLRISYALLIKTKSEMMQVVRDLDKVDASSPMDTYDELLHTAKFLKCLHNYAHTAAMRLLISASAIAYEEHRLASAVAA